MNDQELGELQRTLSAVGEQYRQHMDALAQNLAAMFQPMQNQLAATAAAIAASAQPQTWRKLRSRAVRIF